MTSIFTSMAVGTGTCGPTTSQKKSKLFPQGLRFSLIFFILGNNCLTKLFRSEKARKETLDMESSTESPPFQNRCTHILVAAVN